MTATEKRKEALRLASALERECLKSKEIGLPVSEIGIILTETTEIGIILTETTAEHSQAEAG